MKLRLATWNMAYWQHKMLHEEAWDHFLNHVEADFYLFQEARPTDTLISKANSFVWSEIGGRRDWGSGIYSPRYKIFEETIDTVFTGVFKIGNTIVDDNHLTLISLYGLMESHGSAKGYSVTNLHRIFSDLTGLLNGHINGKRKIVIAGDINASTQFDAIQKDNSHKILFDRIEDFGLNDVYRLSGNANHVQTLRYAGSPKLWQNDYFFVSDSLAKKFRKYEILDDAHTRKFSDHNIVIIELDI